MTCAVGGGDRLRRLGHHPRHPDRRPGHLFDLWLVLTTLEPDEALIVEALRHYMHQDVFGFANLATNLAEKLDNREFREDLAQLVVNVPAEYEPDVAANMVMEHLGARLNGAPEAGAIRGGAWRREPFSLG